MRYLVTGGAGFLGSYVVKKLRERGCGEVFVPRSNDYDLVQLPAARKLYADSRPDIVIHPSTSPSTRFASGRWLRTGSCGAGFLGGFVYCALAQTTRSSTKSHEETQRLRGTSCVFVDSRKRNLWPLAVGSIVEKLRDAGGKVLLDALRRLVVEFQPAD